MAWIDIPDPSSPKRLLFRYDPDRDIVQIQERGVKHNIDLQEVRKNVIRLGSLSLRVVVDPSVPPGEIRLVSSG